VDRQKAWAKYGFLEVSKGAKPFGSCLSYYYSASYESKTFQPADAHLRRDAKVIPHNRIQTQMAQKRKRPWLSVISTPAGSMSPFLIVDLEEMLKLS
jgi:hypothetical protein